MMAPPFRLSEEERRTPLWGKLRAHLELRLADKRMENDRPLSAENTAALRGEIKAIKEMIALEKPPVILPTTE